MHCMERFRSIDFVQKREADHANAAKCRAECPDRELPAVCKKVADGNQIRVRAGSRKTIRGIHLQELRSDARPRMRIAVKLAPMPDLKLKLDRLFVDAADCEMVGRLAADPDKRAQYRRKAEELRAVAERVRSQIASRPRSDTDFLLQQAQRCRGLSVTLADDALKADLLTLAEELEQTAKRARGVS